MGKYSTYMVSRQPHASQLEATMCGIYWENLVRDKLEKWAFFDGSIVSADQYIEAMMMPDKAVFFVLDNTTLVGQAHFTGWSGLCAMGHFSVLKSYHKDAYKIGRTLLEHVFNMKRDPELPFIDTVMGLTPLVNRAAVKYALNLGFKKVTIIPNSYFWPKESGGKYVDSMLSMIKNPNVVS